MSTGGRRQSAAVKAAATFVSTLVTLGAATLAASTVATAVIRGVAAARSRRTEVGCPACAGSGRLLCACCGGRRALAWQPFKQAATRRWTLCPLCAGVDGESGGGRQKCWDCGGRGRARPRPPLDGLVIV
jgi:hypothetical protein